ncbi:MAG: hypothetical protein ACRDQU_05245 [Pseudonocardiaceae bacterium]
MRAMSSNDERFVVPLYSAAEAARHLDVPASTFRAWAAGYQNLPKRCLIPTGRRSHRHHRAYQLWSFHPTR